MPLSSDTSDSAVSHNTAQTTNSPTNTQKRWRRRLGLALISCFLLFVLLFSLLYWLVPHAATVLAPKWLAEKTGRTLSVNQAVFNPFTLHLQLEGVSLKDGKNTLAAFKALDLKGAWSSVTNMAWTASGISLVSPELNMRTNADGNSDWARFIAALPKSKDASDKSLPRIILQNITIKNAAVRLFDEQKGEMVKRIEIEPLSFNLDRMSTLPKDRGDYALLATLNDNTQVQWKGRVGLNPIESSGELAITKLPLAKLAAMLGTTLPVNLSGTGAFKSQYSAAMGDGFVALGLGDGILSLSDFELSNAQKDSTLAKSLIVSPVSLSWASQNVDGKNNKTFAVEPMQVQAKDLVTRTSGTKEAMISALEAKTGAPITVDVPAQKINIPQVMVSQLRLQIERDAEGHLSLPFIPPADLAKSANLATPSASTRPSSNPGGASNAAPWRIELGELSTDKALLNFTDRSFQTPQRAELKIDATLGALIETSPAGALKISGKRLTMSEIKLRDQVAAPSGASGSSGFGAGGVVSLPNLVSLPTLAKTEKSPSSNSAANAPWFSVKSVRALPFEIDLNANKIVLPKFEILEPQLNASLGVNGLDLASKLKSPPTKNKPSTSPPASAGAPAFSFAGLMLTGGRVRVEDSTITPAQTHTLEVQRFQTGPLELDGSAAMSANLAASLGSGGNLQGKALINLKSMQGDIDFELSKLSLPSLSVYLNQMSRLKIAKGEAASAGKIKLGANGAWSLDAAGSVKEVNLTDESSGAPFASWSNLSSKNIKLRSTAQGMDISLADIVFDQPRGKIVVDENRNVNWTKMSKSSPSNKQSATPLSDNKAAALKVRVDRLQITEGDIEFADLSLKPQFGTRVTELSGLVVGLSSEPAARAEVSLEGKVDQYGLAQISGSIAPLGATEHTDIKANFRNLEMSNMSPYSGKFAGRKIESGKLNLNLEYKIEGRKLLGSNQIAIKNITLGERVESPDATSLPLDLAIAILRDSDGKIDLDMNVEGSLDDPKFSYGNLIWKAIVNVLSKVATAPFRALGHLLGGSAEEFEFVSFDPGEARLLPPEREKLSKLIKALEQRPQLKLSIEGRFDKDHDREALADNLVKLEVSKRAGMKPPSANEPLLIAFTDSKVQEALDDMAAAKPADEVAKIRAQFLPAADGAVSGLMQAARERLTDAGRKSAAEARAGYYPALFKYLRSQQPVADIAFTELATRRAEAIRGALTDVNKFDATRVSAVPPQAVKEGAKSGKSNKVRTTLSLSTK